jgi:hypothetical protein
MVIHAPSAAVEFVLCGFAFDAYDSGDADEPIIEAKPGETVTCPECRAVIDYMRKAYPRGYRFSGEVII